MLGKALTRGLLAATVLLFAVGAAPAGIVIDMVRVGDAGNAADTRYNGISVGSVGNQYDIGKYEITAGQYTAFLNAVAATDTYGLYSSRMGDTSRWEGCNIQQSGVLGSYTYTVAADWANRPVNYVSFWDAARFANWLNNGQPTGLQNALTTEDGAYNLNGYTGQDGRTITRKAGARFWLPSVDEWYKAAFYKGGGTNAGYWDYATQSNTPLSNILTDPDPGNNGNFYGPPGTTGYAIGSPYYRTLVGAYANSKGAYNTYDQGGNVWEWNDTLVYQGSSSSTRGRRGASAWNTTYYSAASLSFGDRTPNTELFDTGFRVASVPEPGSIALLAVGGLCALAPYARRGRNRKGYSSRLPRRTANCRSTTASTASGSRCTHRLGRRRGWHL